MAGLVPLRNPAYWVCSNVALYRALVQDDAPQHNMVIGCNAYCPQSTFLLASSPGFGVSFSRASELPRSSPRLSSGRRARHEQDGRSDREQGSPFTTSLIRTGAHSTIIICRRHSSPPIAFSLSNHSHRANHHQSSLSTGIVSLPLASPPF